MVQPPDRFIAGEESALARWVESGTSLPSFRPDKGAGLRIGRRSALVHNAETLAHVAMIARTGPEEFRAHGTLEDPGTSLVTVSGAVEQPGVVEVDRGTPLIELAKRALPSGPPQALLVGGYGGAWVSPAHFTTPFASLPLRAIGATPGAGIVMVLGERACGLMESARIAHYLAGQSAGQCGPCVYGLPAVADDLMRLARGRADPGLLARLHRRLGEVDGRGACRHPDGAVHLVRSALHVFAADLDAHARRDALPALEPTVAAPVPRRGTGGLIVIRILVDPVACDAYGYCAELLPEAVSLDEWGYPIVDGRPLPRGARRRRPACGPGLSPPRHHVAGVLERPLTDPGDATMAGMRRDRP